MNQDNKVIIFDTTLRDGEQAPGCSMTLGEKLKIAHALKELNVDVIEAGFAAASPGDFESVKAIASEIDGPTICTLARCNERDIEQASLALEPSNNKRIHVFVATSEIHLKHKLNMAKEEVLKAAFEGVKMAKSFCDDVEFSPEDASRTDHDFLTEVVNAAIDAGATTINIPDTVGYTIPYEFGELFQYLISNCKNSDKVIFSVHCHDDLGLSVANSLAALESGARQVECTINGIGERAGNTSLEEITMAIKTRKEYFDFQTSIDSTKLYPTSRLVSSITGMHVPRNKAIVGDNAFAHEAGIHQHGMLRHASTYEIMKPQDVGIARSNLVLGKHSGRHAFLDRVKELGFELDEGNLNPAFKEFKKLADRKKDIFDSDIEAIVLNTKTANMSTWELVDLETSSGSSWGAQASVKLKNKNGTIKDTKESISSKNGPIESVFKAIENITGYNPKLINFEIHSVSMGDDAQGEVTVTVNYEGQDYRGHGISTDIIESGALAYLEVINRIDRNKNKNN
jgi:2-isopropylmalate synthase